MAIITNISSLDPVTLELQEYSSDDENIISSFNVTDIPFSSSSDIIEYHIYDFNNNIQDLVDYIIQIDQDDDLYSKIKNEALFTPSQDPKNKFDLFLSDLKTILVKLDESM